MRKRLKIIIEAITRTDFYTRSSNRLFSIADTSCGLYLTYLSGFLLKLTSAYLRKWIFKTFPVVIKKKSATNTTYISKNALYCGIRCSALSRFSPWRSRTSGTEMPRCTLHASSSSLLKFCNKNIEFESPKKANRVK